jgi:hypothetical protein
MKSTLLLCCLALLCSTAGCGGKKPDAPVDPAAALEARYKSAEKLSDPTAQADEYLAIARDQLAAKQDKAAHKPLKLAGEAVGKITRPTEKGKLAAELAILHAQAKQSAESQAALAQAQGSLARIKDDPLAKVLLQARIAVAQHELGSKQQRTRRCKPQRPRPPRSRMSKVKREPGSVSPRQPSHSANRRKSPRPSRKPAQRRGSPRAPTRKRNYSWPWPKRSAS